MDTSPKDVKRKRRQPSGEEGHPRPQYDNASTAPLYPSHPPSRPVIQSSLHVNSSQPQQRIHPHPLRSTSPTSVTSSLAAAGPPLRKKSRSLAINETGLRKTSGILRATPANEPSHYSDQAYLSHPATGTVVTTTNTSANSASKPLARADSAASFYLSPTQQRRPPASNSSYGVETTYGPPPSYSTQRTLSQERIRKVDRNALLRMQVAADATQHIPTHDYADVTGQGAGPFKEDSGTPLAQSSPDTTDSRSIPTPTGFETMPDVRVREDYGGGSMEEENKGSSSDERKSEDLFLNIARVDAARPTYSKTEKKKSRISLPFLSNVRSSQSVKSSPIQHQPDSTSSIQPRSNSVRSHTRYASMGQHETGASSRIYLAGNTRVRDRSAERPLDNDRFDQASQVSRRTSTVIQDQSKPAQLNSFLSNNNSSVTTKNISEGAHPDPSRAGEHNATESTVSTTAPSTVWDELDDLKSRIRKLELTGKLPTSSAAAMGLAERPKTATTAATTLSISPKYKPSEFGLQSPIEGIPSQVHPLLHEALANVRTVINNEVYQKLQATAQDALQLAAMMGGDTPGNPGGIMHPSTERQIKRQTDSMCRSLTELAIALAAESKPVGHTHRPPSSHNNNHAPGAILRSRRQSNEPPDRPPVTTRVHSRLDSRRRSVHLGANPSTRSPERESYSPTTLTQHSEPRLGRSSTTFRKRGTGLLDGADDDLEASPSVRPMSRAMTELGAYRHTSYHNTAVSREYTGQQAPPSRGEQYYTTSTPLPSSASTNFTSRRRYASPGSVLGTQDTGPMTPRDVGIRKSLTSVELLSPDTMSEVARGGSMPRSNTTGFASRLGSNVGSRLRAVRNERNRRESSDDRGFRENSEPMRGNEQAELVDMTRGT